MSTAADISQLDTLIATINREHGLAGIAIKGARAATVAMLDHAIAAGEALLEARPLVGPNAWTKWVEENLDLHRQTVQHYMRLAKYKDILRESEATSMVTGLRLLRGLPSCDARIGSEGPDWYEAARRMYAAGEKMGSIADVFGVTKASVSRACMNRDDLREQSKAQMQRTAQRRHERQALLKAEQRTGVMRSGGPAADAYSQIRRALQALQAAHDQAKSTASRRKFSAAMAALYPIEDQIAEAIRLDSEPQIVTEFARQREASDEAVDGEFKRQLMRSA